MVSLGFSQGEDLPRIPSKYQSNPLQILPLSIFSFLTPEGEEGSEGGGGGEAEGDNQENHRRFLSLQFFDSPKALFTPVAGLSKHPEEAEMIIAPGNMYEILSVFTFPKNFDSTLSAKNLINPGGKEDHQREDQNQEQDIFFQCVDARLTELFLQSPGTQDIHWTSNLAESLQGIESRINGVVIVKTRNPIAAAG